MVKSAKSPSKTETPYCFVMEGDGKILSAYYGIVDFQERR